MAVAHVDEPIYNVAHLLHAELLTPRLEESQHFFTDVLSLLVVAQQDQSVFLRAYGDYERSWLTLTEAPARRARARRLPLRQPSSTRAACVAAEPFGLFHEVCDQQDGDALGTHI